MVAMYINSRLRFPEAWTNLKGADGILVPGGFGDRGIEGKVLLESFIRLHRKGSCG